MRRRPRVDRNHREVTEALEAVGASVQSLAAVGEGCPDLLVARAGCIWLIEVKDGSKRPSARQLTKDQQRWVKWFNADVHVVTTVDQALDVVLRSPVREIFAAGASVESITEAIGISASTVERQLRKGRRT